MPNCKNCHSRISKFDKDFCPICGVEHPLDGATYDTIDITKEISLSEELKNVKIKKRLACILLSFFLGFLGIPFFYLNYKKVGFIVAGSSLGLFGLLLLVIILASHSWLWAILAPALVMLVINIVIGIYFILRQNLKTYNGELVK